MWLSAIKLASDKAKAKDVRILKGPKSQYIELIGDKYEKRKTQQFNNNFNKYLRRQKQEKLF